MSYTKKLNEAFRNPPTTGAGQGGPPMIPNSMGPLPISWQDINGRPCPNDGHCEVPRTSRADQTTLRETFRAGKKAARNGITQSVDAGQTEFRNFDRGRIEAGDHESPNDVEAYDIACAVTGDPHGRV